MSIQPPPKLILNVLSDNDTARIHQAVLQVLEETGVRILDGDTQDLLTRNGCRAGDDHRLRIPAERVAGALETLPPKVVFYDRNGSVRVDTAAARPHFTNGINCLDVLDHETGEHRPCRLEDVRTIARVCERLVNIDMILTPGCPGDVPPSDEALAAVQAVVANSQKPIGFTGHDDREVQAIWSHLAEVAGGWAALADKPCGMDLADPISPLAFGADACARLRFAARRHLPVACHSGLFPGATGPVTLAGAIVQCAAEVLAGVVIHQCEAPGAPLLTGSGIIPLDMQTGAVAFGSPFQSLASTAQVDLFNALGVPTWTCAGTSNAHTVDAQAAAEAGRDIFAAAVSGTALVHGLGRLSGGKTASLEMLVLGDELAGAARQLAAGIPVTEDTLAVEVIRRNAAAARFLQDDHTLDHFRAAAWVPHAFSCTDLKSWNDGGRKTAADRTRQRLQALLAGIDPVDDQ